MIYFMQPVGGGPIKIGYSEDVERRHRELERHYGRSLAILVTIPGDIDLARGPIRCKRGDPSTSEAPCRRSPFSTSRAG